MGNLQKEKYFLQYYKNHFRQFCVDLQPEVKGMVLFTIDKFFPYNCVHGEGEGK